MVARREVWVRALLPALLAAHQRKSSVHQKFLSLLIIFICKWDAEMAIVFKEVLALAWLIP